VHRGVRADPDDIDAVILDDFHPVAGRPLDAILVGSRLR
jgi:hypothetical protein